MGSERRSARRALTAAVVCAALLSGAALAWSTWVGDDYPCNASKGVGFGRAIDAPPPTSLPPTPEAALKAFATSGAPRMTAEPIPADGWVEYRGRWVHELANGSWYEVRVIKSDLGWETGDYKVCSR